MRSRLQLGSRILIYPLYRTFGSSSILPVNVTLSVTNQCNSRCRTCFIWTLYDENPQLKEGELRLGEFEKVFASIGETVFWFTLSGGEPFLRADLPEIYDALCQHCNPSIVNIPTNALLPEKIEKNTKRILEKSSTPSVVINLSLDGLEEKHDEIRGVPRNFQRFLDTYQRLTRLRTEFPHLHLGIHSVVSKYSIKELLDVYEFAKKMGSDSYITEVAEQRAELFNKDKDITPSPKEYEEYVKDLIERMRNDHRNGRDPLSRTTQAFRSIYYQIAAEELWKKTQVIPCYAGYASCQISTFGDVWPCCTLGYNYSMGNLREQNYNFRNVWFSSRANEIRKYLKAENCSCPLANAHYTNILCNPFASLRVLLNVLHA